MGTNPRRQHLSGIERMKDPTRIDPPFGEWIRAPTRYGVLFAAHGIPAPLYDPDLPPVMMAPPPYAPPPNVSHHASRMTAPPPPPYASNHASQMTGRPPYMPHFAATSPPLDGPHLNDLFDTIVMYGSRHKRQMEALCFKDYSADEKSNKSVRKVCIRETAIYDYPDKFFGITWVAFHGMDSICVVTRNKDLVHLEQEVSPCVGHLCTEDFLTCFWNVIISEIEDIESRFGESCEMFNGSSVKPFALVCVFSGNDEVEKLSGHEASSVEYDAEKAIKFLQDEIKTDSAFTFDKTVLTAISAFQHLFLQKFEADEIRVLTLKKTIL